MSAVCVYVRAHTHMGDHTAYSIPPNLPKREGGKGRGGFPKTDLTDLCRAKARRGEASRGEGDEKPILVSNLSWERFFFFGFFLGGGPSLGVMIRFWGITQAR